MAEEQKLAVVKRVAEEVVYHEALAPKVEVILDKPRYLAMDLNILATIEKRTGISLGLGSSDILRRMSVNVLRAILTASLQEEDPTLTEEQVGKMIFPQNMKYVVSRLNKVWEDNSAPEEPPSTDPLAPSPKTEEVSPSSPQS